jgi:hypothetical protein
LVINRQLTIKSLAKVIWGCDKFTAQLAETEATFVTGGVAIFMILEYIFHYQIDS